VSDLIGTSVPRRDAPAKVTGAARYTDDLAVEGAWFGLTVRSTEPHARLLGIDRDPAFDWSRAVVVTAADIPGENVVHLMSDDQPALVADEIRHHAEAVALVAAPDPATARAARAAISLRTEPLPAVLDLLTSEKSFARYEIAKGDLERGFAEADRIVEGTYRVGPQEHIYIEPQAMIATPEAGGGVTVTGSLQCPYYVHAALARALALPIGQVRVMQAETGGGFGGKEEYPSMLAIHAALLARAAGRPVRMTYDRHEDIVATTKRHSAVVRHRTGVAADGRLVAQEIDAVMDAGAYATLSPVVLSRGALHATGPYRCPNVRVRARAVMTNTVPSGAFRGFGAPQTEFAAEVHLSRIAEALGLSPAELRRRLAYREGDVTATGQVLRESVAALDVLRRRPMPRATRGSWRTRPSGAPATRGGPSPASGWRWAGMARRSPVAARSGWRAWRRSSWTPRGASTRSPRTRRWGRAHGRCWPRWWPRRWGSPRTRWRSIARTPRRCRTAGPQSPRGPRWSWAGCWRQLPLTSGPTSKRRPGGRSQSRVRRTPATAEPCA
jgi:CO/xanthine dehydrogenase Mo-binding subunit